MMRSYWIRVSPIANDWGLHKERFEVTEEALSRRPWDEGGGEWTNATLSQGAPCVAGNHKKLGELITCSSQGFWMEGGPADSLIVDFQPPTCERRTSVIQSNLVGYTILRNHAVFGLCLLLLCHIGSPDFHMLGQNECFCVEFLS